MSKPHNPLTSHILHLKTFDIPLAHRAMLAWFDQHQRTMPWRKSPPDPYHVLVSEAMLQQTQVATVIPYFSRFIAAFPTAHDLARADEQLILKLWQGLGYYRRARNLHAAAKAIVDNHAGQIPSSVDALLALPGIGRYTAGAVASIGHGIRAPLVDGNVMRVLTRWFAIPDSTDLPATQKQLWATAEALVPHHRPGDFNQSLMELGATLCTPANPQCLLCPVAAQCQANLTGQPEQYPVRSPKKKPTAIVHKLVFIQHQGRYLFTKRPDTGLWAGLWQCPTIELSAPGKPNATKASLTTLTKALKALQTPIHTPVWLSSFVHQTTHRTITFRVYHASLIGPPPPESPTLTWRTLDTLQDLPVSVAQTKALAALHAAIPLNPKD